MKKLLLFVVITGTLQAQSPIIRDQFTADPTARVSNGKVYVSSSNLTHWTDHGVILTQNKVPKRL